MTLLLRGQTRSGLCFGTPASATKLLLLGQVRSDRCFGTPASATTLLLRGQARSDRCFGTPASARHFCYVGRHVLSVASTLLLVLRHLSTVLYLRVLIVLCPTHFL